MATETPFYHLPLYETGARVTQIADINTGKLAEHRTDETPAIGNLTIFNDTTPRVTNPTTGDKYPPLS